MGNGSGVARSTPEGAPTRPGEVRVGVVTVAITRAPARFAPSVESCEVQYRITGTATAAQLEVRDRGGTLLARIAGIPFATGANTYTWDGRTNQGTARFATPHDSALALKVVTTPAAESAPRAVAIEVHSIEVADGRTGDNPERMLRPESGSDRDPRVELTATVKLKRSNNTGVVTQVAIGVDWVYEADAANCPRNKGGKDDTSRHFEAVSGFAMTGGNSYAANPTNTSGQSRVKFVASEVAGDKFRLVARVLQTPGTRTSAVLATQRGRTYEVWRQFTYSNFFQIPSGVSLATISTEANVQTVFTPAFTKFNRGAGAVRDVTNASLTGEYLAPLAAPRASELPAASRLKFTSDGEDTRTVTVRGKVRSTNAGGEVTGTSDDSETITLRGTTPATGTKYFQKLDRVTVSASNPARALNMEPADGPHAGNADHVMNITMFLGRGTSVPLDLVFEDESAVQTKAQAWVDRNWRGINSAVDSLRSATSSGYCMVGGRYLHPKHASGRTTRTTFYAGYSNITITAVSTDSSGTLLTAHPDAPWPVAFLGWASRNLIIILQGGASGQAQDVVRHEVAHASDHHPFGTGSGSSGASDHCAQTRCLMAQIEGRGQLCTTGTDHSRKRMMGWQLP